MIAGHDRRRGADGRRNPFLAARRLHRRHAIDAVLVVLATGSATVAVMAMGAMVALGA